MSGCKNGPENDVQTSSAVCLSVDEEVIEAIQNAGTPEEKAEVIASELPASVSVQEELSGAHSSSIQ